jgi:hypothetical protein
MLDAEAAHGRPAQGFPRRTLRGRSPSGIAGRRSAKRQSCRKVDPLLAEGMPCSTARAAEYGRYGQNGNRIVSVFNGFLRHRSFLQGVQIAMQMQWTDSTAAAQGDRSKCEV